MNTGTPTEGAFTAQCIFEPRGSCGLEGYCKGDNYRAEFFKTDVAGKPYYRVYPVEGDDYYETCSPTVFNRFFKQVKTDATQKA